MKVRGIFNIEEGDTSHKKSESIFTIEPYKFKQTRHIVNTLNNTNLFERITNYGSLLTFRHANKKNWWLDAATSIAKEKNFYKGSSNFSNQRTGFDDILLTGGYIFYPNNKIQLVLYGSAGFPTRLKVTTLEAQNNPVGTRFFNLGAGYEASYCLFKNKKRSFFAIFQNRFLHFFNRKWFPILPLNEKIQPGNVTDLLFTLNYNEGKNIFETGYDITFFTNDATLLPEGEIKDKSFNLHNYYLSYLYIINNIFKTENSFTFGGGIWITRSKRFDTKSFTYWLSFSFIF